DWSSDVCSSDLAAGSVSHGVYFISEQGRTFRISVPKFGSWVGYYRILAHQRSRFNRYYFYIRDEVLGPIVLRVASFFPFSRHLLAQRPLLHRAGTESQPYLLQKGTQPDEPVPFLGHGAG